MVYIRGNELNPAPKTRVEIWLENDILEWFSRQGQAQSIENYHNLIEEALHEYIQFYPALHRIEKESNSVLTNLADFIDEPEKQVFPKKQSRKARRK